MAYAETGDTHDYLVARNNMLQDTTVVAGALAISALVEMPQAAEVATLGLASIFAVSGLRFAAHLHFIKQHLRDTDEW
jgi:hypothetical protein